MPCWVCPEGQVLTCPGCGHDIHSHSASTGCGLCPKEFVPGKSLMAEVCNMAPPFIGSQAPVVVNLDGHHYNCEPQDCDPRCKKGEAP